MKTVGSSEILSLIYQITWCHISQDRNLNIYPCDNLICCNDTLRETSLIYPVDGSSRSFRNISVAVRPKKCKNQIQHMLPQGLPSVLSELLWLFPSKPYYLSSRLRVHDVTLQKSVTWAFTAGRISELILLKFSAFQIPLISIGDFL
jgi:hypothetical protein